jgi:phage-related protein
MSDWKIEFFPEGGSFPVREWLNDLPEEVRAKVLARIELLKKHGPTLDYPYTSQIEGRLREARLRLGKSRYRVLYFFDDARTGILLHAFTKNTESVEQADKAIGKRRMAAHISRRAAQQTASGGKRK